MHLYIIKALLQLVERLLPKGSYTGTIEDITGSPNVYTDIGLHVAVAIDFVNNEQKRR